MKPDQIKTPINKDFYISKKINKLTILEFVKPPEKTKDKLAKYHKWVLCKCDCGKISTKRLSALLNGITGSCGCLRALKGEKSPYFTGCGEISGKFFSQIKRTANGGTNKRKRLYKNFDVTVEYLWELFLKQNRKCAITGIPLSFAPNLEKLSKGTASLDRIDSNKGYTEDNVQWVHKTINMMKNKLSMSEFIAMCKLVSKNNKNI
jgi:hypothetical protein